MLNYNIFRRINRMLPALVIRSIFPRPIIIPRLGQSTERFILIDNPNSISYQLPEPECNYVFIIQSTGKRLIEFQPAKECVDQCEPVSVLLRESYLCNAFKFRNLYFILIIDIIIIIIFFSMV